VANIDYYRQLESQILAIPPDKVVSPTMPVETMAKEGEMLYSWVQDDKESFLKVNFDWSIVDSLAARIGAALYAESVWSNRRIQQKDAQKEFAELRIKAEDLKDEVLGAMEYAFHGNTDLSNTIVDIRKGDSSADTVLDLTRAADLGVQNKALLDATNFSYEKITEIAELGSKLGTLLGASDAAILADCKERIVRDKAFTYLKDAIDKIRLCGKHVCRINEERYKGYISQYAKTLNRRYRTSTPETTETSATAK